MTPSFLAHTSLPRTAPGAFPGGARPAANLGWGRPAGFLPGVASARLVGGLAALVPVRDNGVAGCGAASRVGGGRDGGEPFYVEGCGCGGGRGDGRSMQESSLVQANLQLLGIGSPPPSELGGYTGTCPPTCECALTDVFLDSLGKANGGCPGGISYRVELIDGKCHRFILCANTGTEYSAGVVRCRGIEGWGDAWEFVKECAELADALATASEEATSILNNWMQYWRTCAGPRGCTGNSHEMYRKAWNEAIERVNSASQALVDAGCGPGIVLR